MQPDLFGNKPQEKTSEDEYREYISSSKWRLKRSQAIYRADHKCERCGETELNIRLEVHHKHYDNFGHEKPDDLEVVCEACHEKADEERRREVAMECRQRQRLSLYYAQLNGWASKVYGRYWERRDDTESIEEQFNTWKEWKDR